MEEVTLKELLKPIIKNYRLIVIFVIVFAVIGIIIVKKTPKEYTASSIFLPQSNSSELSNNGLGSLASLAGINLTSNPRLENFPPRLYEKMLENIDVKREIFGSQLWVDSLKDSISVLDYTINIHRDSPMEIIKKYTIGLPSLLPKKSNSQNQKQSLPNGIQALDTKEIKYFSKILNKINISVDQQLGTVTISASLQDPLLVAQLTRKIEEIIKKRLIEYQLSQANKEYDMTLKIYQEKSREYELAQSRYSEFMDSNLNLTTQRAKLEENKLRNELDLKFEIFKQLATALEASRLKLSKATPNIVNIVPVVVPNEKSGPRSFLMLIAFVLMGMVIPVAYLILKLRVRVLLNFIQNN